MTSPDKGAIDGQSGLSDKNLRRIARECWSRAGSDSDPREVETAAQAAVARALDFAAEQSGLHIAAVDVFKEFQRIGRSLLRRAPNAFTSRLHRSIWYMAQRLYETSVYDPALRCRGKCLGSPPGRSIAWVCPGQNSRQRATCARSLTFPYLKQTRAGYVANVDKTAKAIVRGIELAKIRQPNGQCWVPTNDAVRKAIVRYPETH